MRIHLGHLERNTPQPALRAVLSVSKTDLLKKEADLKRASEKRPKK
jgi:hypothetical protein